MSTKEMLAMIEEETSSRHNEYFGIADHWEMMPHTAQDLPASRQEMLLTLLGSTLLIIAIACVLLF